MKENIKNIRLLFIISLAGILSFCLRFYSFQQTSFATGWDSYFYLIQIKSLLEEGAMHSSDLSLVYPFMRLIYFLIGDYELMFKISAALLSAFFTISVGTLSLKISKHWQLTSLTCAFTLCSPHLTYFAAQYPKNLLGLSLFLFFITQTPMLFDNKSTLRQWVLCISLLLLNVFGHRMTAVLALIFLTATIIFTRVSLKWLLYLSLSFIGLLLLGILLPGLLSIADLARFEGFVSSTPQWAPLSFWQSFGTERISLPWVIELVVVNAIMLLLLIVGGKTLFSAQKNSVIIWLGLCSLLVFPFYTWTLDGIGYRFFLTWALLTPIGLWLLITQYEKSIRRFGLWISMVLTLASPLSISGYQSVKHDPPYALYQQLTDRSLDAIHWQELELVIAHKSLAEYFTFKSGIDALPWIPEYEISKEKLWRIATDININQYQYYLKDAPIYRLSATYSLVREDHWQLFLDKLKADEGPEAIERFKTWKNPHRVRPFYLLKNKK